MVIDTVTLRLIKAKKRFLLASVSPLKDFTFDCDCGGGGGGGRQGNKAAGAFSLHRGEMLSKVEQFR